MNNFEIFNYKINSFFSKSLQIFTHVYLKYKWTSSQKSLQVFQCFLPYNRADNSKLLQQISGESSYLLQKCTDLLPNNNFVHWLCKNLLRVTKSSFSSRNNFLLLVTFLLLLYSNNIKKNKITLNKKGVNYKIKTIPSTGSQYNNDNSQQVEG